VSEDKQQAERTVVATFRLPVSIASLVKITSAMEDEHGKDLWMKQEGMDLVIFKTIVEEG